METALHRCLWQSVERRLHGGQGGQLGDGGNGPGVRLDGLHPWPRTPGKDVNPQWSTPLRAPLTNGL